MRTLLVSILAGSVLLYGYYTLNKKQRPEQQGRRYGLLLSRETLINL